MNIRFCITTNCDPSTLCIISTHSTMPYCVVVDFTDAGTCTCQLNTCPPGAVNNIIVNFNIPHSGRTWVSCYTITYHWPWRVTGWPVIRRCIADIHTLIPSFNDLIVVNRNAIHHPIREIILRITSSVFFNIHTGACIANVKIAYFNIF